MRTKFNLTLKQVKLNGNYNNMFESGWDFCKRAFKQLNKENELLQTETELLLR